MEMKLIKHQSKGYFVGYGMYQSKQTNEVVEGYRWRDDLNEALRAWEKFLEPRPHFNVESEFNKLSKKSIWAGQLKLVQV